VLLLTCIFSFGVVRGQSSHPLKLWYTHPAGKWVEALPLANGRLGAMVFGDPSKETIQLNEYTLWAGGPNNNLNPEAKSVIPQIRKLIFSGKYLEAQKLTNAKAGPKGNSGMPYQSAGDLIIQFSHPDTSVTHYYRDLDLEKAVASTSYVIGTTRYSEKVFTSFPDQVIIIHLAARGPDKINCQLRLKSRLRHQVTVKENALYLNGVSGDHEGQKGRVKYTTIVKPILSGGRITATDTSLHIQGADSATLYVSIATNFVSYKNLSADNEKKAIIYLDKAIKKPFLTALKEHISTYSQYFDRVSLDLGTTDSIQNPTDVRIAQFQGDNDPQLAALYFQFGRYLLICSSRPGGQPATLQGIWNNSIDPPWDSKYTVNINTEMNYWPADKTNLSEMIDPLMQMVKELSVTGRQSARARYGARGWVLHHNTDIWRITGVVDGGYYLWPEGGTWLLENLWEHYLYTGDKHFLEQLYPLLKGACEFFVDELQVEPTHHWLVVCPTMSPEHSYMEKDGVSIDITDGATMDNQLVFDLFSHTMTAAKILGSDKQFSDTLRMKKDSLPPMQIGRYGQLQEWLQDWDNPHDHHRHVSHLYGLFPSNQISPYRTPKLFEAARTSLIYRGDVSTGWSMAWKINLWAHLLDGNHALKLLRDQLSPAITSSGEHGGTYPNLFDACPPFQIDGNFGCTSGITEMLLQSGDGGLFVLPALPENWKSGQVKGLRGRGGFIVDISWQRGKVSKLTIHSTLGGNCRIRVYDPLKPAGSFVMHPAVGTNPNLFFEVPRVKAPLVSSGAHLKALSLPRTYLYDFKTKAGKTYVLEAL
jgi:alpha-L-fucosidase 2